MFLKFYGLKEQPFGVTPDPRFLYMGRAQEEALSSLIYGIETGRGFMALIASPGLGKTTILMRLMERLRDSARTAFLFQTHSSSQDLLRSILFDLEIEPNGHDLGDLQRQLGDVLIEGARSGRRLVVAIDEAQNLDESVLETVRTLSNYETPQAKLVQIILVGQPQLAEKLSSPNLDQLRQRVSIVTHFPPLGSGDIPKYIHHRLRVAGYQGGALFTPGALGLIAACSRGIPRNINNLCFHCLSLGFATNSTLIDEKIVREVLHDLNLEPRRNTDSPAVAAVSGSADATAAFDGADVTPASAPEQTTTVSSPVSFEDVRLTSESSWDEVNSSPDLEMYPYTMAGRGGGQKHGVLTGVVVLALVALAGFLLGGQKINIHFGNSGQATATSDTRNKSTEPPAPLPSSNAGQTDEQDPATTPSAPAEPSQSASPSGNSSAPVAPDLTSSATENNPPPAIQPAIAARVPKEHPSYLKEVSQGSSSLPAGSGRLVVESSQSGARITINGESNRLWVTPRIFYLASGTYVVTVSTAGYSSWTRRVHLDDGREKFVMAELQNHENGFFTVDTSPAGMQVFIDGKPFGPSRVETVLQSGWHVCEVIPGPGLQPLIRKFHLGPGESITRRIRMSSPEAALGKAVQRPSANLVETPQ